MLTRDWAAPRTACSFTGYSGTRDSPIGTLLLCVANTPIPCKPDLRDGQKAVQFTVINIRKAGWGYAPWKKPTGKNTKASRDDSAKELFEAPTWAKNDVTMERVMDSIKMYTFAKDGQNKGERSDRFATLAAGQTFRFMIQDFMYESKKSEEQQVFPSDVGVIPAFSVVEIMVCPSNTNSFGEGYGFSVQRIRPCDFSLHSLLSPLGLGILPGDHEASMQAAEAYAEANPGLRRIVETRGTGFHGRVQEGSYLVPYSADLLRLVGPKEDPSDPGSRHLPVMPGGVFAVDIRRDVLLQFTNAVDPDEECALGYAHLLVDLASAAGALECYVTYNEYLLRSDPNRSPYTGVPLVDTRRLLDCIQPAASDEPQCFPLPFQVPTMFSPFIVLDPAPQASEAPSRLPCEDFVLASEGGEVARAYRLRVGDTQTEDIMRLLFVPKQGHAQTGPARCDYRRIKRARVE